MKKLVSLSVLTTVVVLLFSCTGNKKQALEDRAEAISKVEMQAVTQFLGDDLLEGRAPGTRGGDLAEKYMVSLCKFLDLEPGFKGSYFQPFELTGFTSSNLLLEAEGTRLNYIEDFVGTFTVEDAHPAVKGEAVFVGFGISADTWNWNDYKDVDVKDKIVITRVNDPGSIHPDIFEGDTLTYYGRWTYHIEEAARRGAVGILLIHTDASAGYDWNVVRNSWTGEELYIRSGLENNMKFRGWVKEASLKRLLNKNGINLDDLMAASEQKDFEPVNLGLNIQVSGTNSTRTIMNNNVVAEIPGKSEKRIVLSAHLDHLGMDPDKEGDNIYNGAIDNGTAVAAMMVTAKILKEYQDELNYTITILGCQAEESGLLGSRYYAQNTNRDEIVANINFESTPVWGKAGSIMGIGARFSEFEKMIKNLAAEDGLEYSEFSLSNQGLFYRSDQFSFARYGIPALWISAGEDEVSGDKHYTEFWSTDYHTVRDEFNEDWPMYGMKQTIKYALLLIEEINSKQSPPKWKSNVSFPMEKE